MKNELNPASSGSRCGGGNKYRTIFYILALLATGCVTQTTMLNSPPCPTGEVLIGSFKCVVQSSDEPTGEAVDKLTPNPLTKPRK